jgi:hypothetical protein
MNTAELMARIAEAAQRANRRVVFEPDPKAVGGMVAVLGRRRVPLPEMAGMYGLDIEEAA